ncbi:hypothetical protein MTR80_10650 [Alcaligenes aquatilis]|uniref:Type 4b pilus protein PilO2 n=1 Tax=Alcaligenes aquatilis TaxID=323284 RepID=A0ABY4NCF3_9BURK|nr:MULTISPECIES: hypothetical protein [Alcaligenes]UQN34766.1 hypothetical protein MTR80_10650 [Alcaligenes aquatilis]
MSASTAKREYWFGLQWARHGQDARWTHTRNSTQSHWACFLEGQAAGQAIGWVQNRWLYSKRTHSILRLVQEGPTRVKRRHMRAYSAAACLAVHHPDEAVFLLWAVAPGLLWFLALEQGLVVEGSDCVLTQVGQVQALRQAMQERYPAIRELRQPDDVWVCLEQGRRVQACMQRQGGRELWRPSKVPLRLLVAPLLVVLALAGVFSADSRGVGAERQPAGKGVLEQGNTLPLSSAQTVLDLIEELPAQGVGWRLQEVDCRRRVASWDCHARYGFEDVQSFSLAMQRQTRAPNMLALTGAGQAELHVQRTYRPKEQQRPSPQGQGTLPVESSANLIAELKALQPAFMRFSLARAQAHHQSQYSGQVQTGNQVNTQLQAKAGEQTQTQIQAMESRPTRDQSEPDAWRRTWSSQSPLRSAYLLAAHLPQLQWDRLSLSVSPQSYPSLLGSVFIVELEGYVDEWAGSGKEERAQVFEHSVWRSADT